MTPVVAVIAAGAMGSAVGRRLAAHGVTVLTSLCGRGAATERRAREAGMTPVADDRLAGADVILSILPPAAALPFAERMAPQLCGRPGLFVDCNAVSPDTVLRIGTVIAASGAAFLDAGIIGTPQRRREPGRPSTSRDQRPGVFCLWPPTASTFDRWTDRSVPHRPSRCPMPASPRD